MAANVGQLSTDELKEIIGSVVEQKLKEILGDPDEGLEMRTEVQNRLLRQKKAVADGERGEELEAVAEEPFLLPETESNSAVHIASPHLADPDKAKDFEMQVFTE
jgi:hypothetical protein